MLEMNDSIKQIKNEKHSRTQHQSIDHSRKHVKED